MEDLSPREEKTEPVEKSLKGSKAIVIGDMGVGKTSIINRYCRNAFERDYKPTIGVEYEVRKYTILDQLFNLQLWDTSGEERFKCITSAYYRGSNAIFVVFSMVDSYSLSNARTWLDEALNGVRTTTPEIFLVGNKKDLCKPSRKEEIRGDAKRMANELNAEYWEVSAKTGENVHSLFDRSAAICFDQAILNELENSRSKNGKVQIGGSDLMAGGPTIKLGKSDLPDPKKPSKRPCCGSTS